MRVMTVVGTRPEIIKLSRVIAALNEHTEHTLIDTKQNYDPALSSAVYREVALHEPSVRSTHQFRKGPLEFVGDAMQWVSSAINGYKPDAMLILGDTNSALAAAYAAKRAKVPLFHMEAGNRCFDDRTPEEVNRRMIDIIADVNLPYTEHARRNLLAMGLREDRIVKTGSPMREVLDYFRPGIKEQRGRPPLSYYVVSCHREENVDNPDRLHQLVDTINKLAAMETTVLVSVHPRLQPKLAKYCFMPHVQLHRPFGFVEYARLQQDALCVISDSGTLSEEAAILGFPAVSIRYATERPEGLEEGSFILSDLKMPDVIAAVNQARAFGRIHRFPPADYCQPNVSAKVVQTITSLTEKVRREAA